MKRHTCLTPHDDIQSAESSSSVSVAALGQDAAGLGELGRGYVEEGGAGHEGQQRQVLLQLVQSGDGDDAVRVEQPVAEQDDQTLLLSHQVLERLTHTHRERETG